LILGSYVDGLLLYQYHPKLCLFGTFTVATQHKIFVIYWEWSMWMGRHVLPIIHSFYALRAIHT